MNPMESGFLKTLLLAALLFCAIGLAILGAQTRDSFTLWCSGFLWGLFAWGLYTALRENAGGGT